MLPALKAALIAADAAGSCLPRGDQEIEGWLADRFHTAPLSAADIQEQLLARRIAVIQGRARMKRPDTVFRYRRLQDAAALLPARALLIAPGSKGKTLAAWRWVGARLSSHPASRVLFLYPTQSADGAGLKVLVLPAPETEASLLNGPAADDLRGIFCNPADAPEDRGEETTARLFAVRLWRHRLLGATLDQFLGFMQTQYRSVCLLPLLADSIIVLDEVNSLDATQLAALTRFLDTFDIPLLGLAASLPAHRRAILARHGLTVCPGDPAELDAIDSQSRAPRYRIHRLAEDGAAQAIAEAALDRNLRVLWVVKSVDRCQALAERLRERNPLCYHTRFRLADRNRRQREIANRFAEAGGPLLLISSPLCEMGLDLDSDLPRWTPGREDLIVPVPRGLASYDPRLPGHLHTASSRYYSDWLGFRRHPLDRTHHVED